MSGGAFVVRRLLAAVGLLFLLATLTFLIAYAVPQDPGQFLLGRIAHPSTEQIEHANEALGVDGSLFEQYRRFVADLVRGDLGLSWASAQMSPDGVVSGDRVAPTLFRAAAVTGSLILGAALLLVVFALPLGAMAGARIGSRLDRALLLVSLAAVSTHPLVVGIVLQWTLGERTGLLPAHGYCPLLAGGDPDADCSGVVAWAQHLVLPWLSLALLFVALYVRMTRTQTAEVLDESYIAAARAKGVSERRVIRRHALPNVLVPIVTMAGMDLGTALGVSLYVEIVFGLPGLGSLLVGSLQGVAGFDRPMIVGIVLVVGAAVVLANLAADLVAARMDPRAATVSPRAGLLGGETP